MNADDLATQAAERVREVVESAERRAEEILEEAREQAGQIRDRAEAEARERLDEVRRALADLEGKIGAGNAQAESPSPPQHEESGAAAEAEEAPPALEGEPAETGAASTDELVEQLRSGGDEKKRDSDTGAARLVALKMALDGASRDEIDKHLADSYSVPNRRKLVDEVLAKASK